MRSIIRFGLLLLVLLVPVALATAMQSAAAGPSCTDCGSPCAACCRGTWEDKKTKIPEYELRCEYACARGRDPWHASDPECRCHPPCGRVYVKKRLFKSETKEKVERVPKYEVELVPAECCGCASCQASRHSRFDPFGILSLFHRH